MFEYGESLYVNLRTGAKVTVKQEDHLLFEKSYSINDEKITNTKDVTEIYAELVTEIKICLIDFVPGSVTLFD